MSAYPYRNSNRVQRSVEYNNLTEFVSAARDAAFVSKWLPAVDANVENYGNIPVGYLRELHAELYTYGPNNDLVKINAKRIYDILRGNDAKRIKFVDQFLNALSPSLAFRHPNRIGGISIYEADVQTLKAQGRYTFPFAYNVSELFDETYSFHLLGRDKFSPSPHHARYSDDNKDLFMCALNMYICLLLMHDYLSTRHYFNTQYRLLNNLAIEWNLLTLD